MGAAAEFACSWFPDGCFLWRGQHEGGGRGVQESGAQTKVGGNRDGRLECCDMNRIG